MIARPGASLCSFLVLWVCALGAGPIGHAAPQPALARSAVELALRDVADAPLFAPRSVTAHAYSARVAERDARSQPAAPVSIARATALGVTRSAPAALALQDAAHAARPRWRAYDAAAPPALFRTAR